MLKFNKIFLGLTISFAFIAGYGGLSSSLILTEARVLNTFNFFINHREYILDRQNRFKETQYDVRKILRNSIPANVRDLGYFGFSPYPIVYGNFNFKALPVFTSFAASTPYLSEINSRAYWKLPDYLLVNYVTIDDRYIYQDDPFQQVYIAQNFEFLKNTDYGTLLIRRKTPLNLEKLSVDEGEAKCKSICTIPLDENKSMLIKFRFGEARFSGLFIHPYWTMVVTYADLTEHAYKFSPTSARIGLLVNVLSSSTMYPAFLRAGDKKISAIQLECRPLISCPRDFSYRMERLIWK